MRRWIIWAYLALLAQPLPAESLANYLERSGSHAALVIELPFSHLQAAIEKRLERQYSGKKLDPTDLLIDDSITWSATPSGVTLSEKNGCIAGASSAHGKARLQGRINFLVGTKSVSATADLRAKASVQACPQISPDWSLNLGLTGRITLTDADLDGLSLRGEFQGALDRMVRNELTAIETDLNNFAIIRNAVAELWNELCDLDSGLVPLAIKPTAVAARQPLVLANAIRFSFVVSGDVRAEGSAAAACPDLPPALILLD